MPINIELHLYALTIAFIIDLLIGDPKKLPHPVVGMGYLISFCEKRLNRGKWRKQKGILFLIVYLLLIGSIVISILFIAYKIDFIFGLIIEAMIISTTIATKSLKDAALKVYIPLRDNDFETARKNVAMIVGRDTNNLDKEEIVRATVETVAENTSDGITAPLFYAFIGGGVLAVLYRAVNTCDSMVGYKNDRYENYGWASARFDDLLNYIPSRVSGLLMVLVNPSLKTRKKDCFMILYRDAKKHPSPNSGWLEAAMAALLGVQLGGRNTYKGIESLRAKMGDRLTALQQEHIMLGNKIMVRTCVCFIVLLWLLGGVFIAIT